MSYAMVIFDEFQNSKIRRNYFVLRKYDWLTIKKKNI